ncbi:MAG: ACT domain-containing protein [Firmicutes bacterium]|nr:ACT domain-containing protein [Bacillota bacterium]
MRAVITVVGKDMVGILAGVSGVCAREGVNVLEVTQSILQEFFAMIMLVDISKLEMPLTALQAKLAEANPGMTIHVMHEDIFNSMHRILGGGGRALYAQPL